MLILLVFFFFFFSSRRRHTRSLCDWSSDVCSSDLGLGVHTITVTATDAATNSATCTTTFTVTDATPPTVTCPAPTSVSAGTNRLAEGREGKEGGSRRARYH